MTSCGGGVLVDAAPGVAPFVAKTYRMVDDPATDGVIAWGAHNNSFVVADPFAFSQTLLPAHFKHSNFSSFVRQLNTYGFRKVDPDRWEFAHVSFLRGQTTLLRHIVRRSVGKRSKDDDAAVPDEDDMAAEVARLKRDQRDIEDRVAAMWRRVQETERRPKQMLAFLVKVAGDPQVLRRLLASSSSSSSSSGSDGPGFASASGMAADHQAIKRQRLLLDSDAAGRRVDVHHDNGLYGACATGEGDFDVDAFYATEDVGFVPPAYAFTVDSATGY